MKKKGFTLVEIMVVVSLFALVFAIASGMFFSLVKNANKVKTLNQVKQNGSYALAVMERMIRNARQATAGTNAVIIVNPDGGQTTFACTPLGGDPVIASSSGTNNFSLIGSEVKTSACSINVTLGKPGVRPAVVEISFTLVPTDVNLRVEERVSIDFRTTVALRNY